MTTAAQAALGGEPAARSREAILAGVIGNALEWYDFAVYGYFVSTISKLFFPSTDPIASLLATYLVFGVGFVMRPSARSCSASTATATGAARRSAP
jgi:MFS transporter, MHS family, proline/betaine transporter